MKDVIRRWIFNLIGYPSETQNLLDYIDSFDSDICIYPAGEFQFGIKVGMEDQILKFPTPQERSSFAAGMSHGVEMMGGSTYFLTDEQLQEYTEMETKASIKGNPKKVN